MFSGLVTGIRSLVTGIKAQILVEIMSMETSGKSRIWYCTTMIKLYRPLKQRKVTAWDKSFSARK